MCPPKEVFRDVVDMIPAKANKDMDKMTMATKISSKVKPSLFTDNFTLYLRLRIGFSLVIMQNRYQLDFGFKMVNGKEKEKIESLNSFKMLKT